MNETIDIARALSDPNRVRALMLLTDGPLCVCQIIEMLGLAASTTSKHMSILKQAGLVEASKDGRWMYYSLPSKNIPKQAKKALQWVVSGLENDSQIRRDKTKLQKLLKMDKETLCRKQRS